MQFAGQRTDEHLQPVGKPDNILIKLSDDVLPDPYAILVHGITPQKTIEEGITEVEFCRYFVDKVAEPGTTFVGYNNIRFDDEFIRRILYRNFYDPYQWHWKDGRSRWDLLDPIRMMRALRPDGLKWPMLEGKPTVKLELMAKENNLMHDNAHDALSDVTALMQLAQTFREMQPKLFNYLLEMRDKKKVSELVVSPDPFLYTSGKYNGEHEKTTLSYTLFKHPHRDSAIVYDLREDPGKWMDMSVDKLVEHWQARYDDVIEQLPVKTLQFNRCPAVAPLGVLDKVAQKRINLDIQKAKENQRILAGNRDFIQRLRDAFGIVENEQQTSLQLEQHSDNKLYDEFWTEGDQKELSMVRSTPPEDLAGLKTRLQNKRMRTMLPFYMARNFPNVLSGEDRQAWEEYRRKVFYAGGNNSAFSRFSTQIREATTTRKLDTHQEYLLTELQLYAESIFPEPPDEAEVVS